VTTPPVTKPHTSPPPPPPSTPSGSPPATPGTINADIPAWFGVDPNIINLSWSAVADTDTFELDVNGTVTSMAGNQTTYTIHNTVFGQQYCFKLRAHNVYGYSAWNVDECVNGS
jgi:hypothetical protein